MLHSILLAPFASTYIILWDVIGGAGTGHGVRTVPPTLVGCHAQGGRLGPVVVVVVVELAAVVAGFALGLLLRRSPSVVVGVVVVVARPGGDAERRVEHERV